MTSSKKLLFAIQKIKYQQQNDFKTKIIQHLLFDDKLIKNNLY